MPAWNERELLIRDRTGDKYGRESLEIGGVRVLMIGQAIDRVAMSIDTLIRVNTQ